MGDRRYKKASLLLVGDTEDRERFDSNGTFNFSAHDIYDYIRSGLAIDIQSTGSPTSLQLYVEVTPDGITWFPIVSDFMGLLVWNAASCATRLYEAYIFDCPGGQARASIITSGCDAANYFDLRAWLMSYNY